MSAFYSKKIAVSANDSRKNEDFCGNFGNGSSENSKKSAESDNFTRNSLKSSGYRYKKMPESFKKGG